VKKIKFGTDGWRAIIAQEFTVDNVARVALATAKWAKIKQPINTSVIIGHDCRFGGELFVETAVKVFLMEGVQVKMSEGFVSTPMISLGAMKYETTLGVIITASHNPASYNGYKLKANFGGPLAPEDVQDLEDMIPDSIVLGYEGIDMLEAKTSGLVEVIDLEGDYVSHVEANFDLDAIRNSGLNFVYDAMYGAGQRVMPRILPSVKLLHCEHNPSFYGQAPEPIAKNLKELESHIKTNQNVHCGLATDGDADRIGLYNSKGEFVDSHHIILLLINYLVNHKKMSGKVVTAFSVTPRVEKMASHFQLEHQTTKIGFKEIASKMVLEDVLIGGEESGGIAVKGHIPERDGIWMGLIIWEFMAKSGKTLEQLIDEVYSLVGTFKFERNDLHITEVLKQKIIAKCKENAFTHFGPYEVKEVKTTDGWKYFFDDERWMMIRASGTEPVLRTYAEAPTLEEVREILRLTEETICK
jgi:phosphomannomutase